MDLFTPMIAADIVVAVNGVGYLLRVSDTTRRQVPLGGNHAFYIPV